MMDILINSNSCDSTFVRIIIMFFFFAVPSSFKSAGSIFGRKTFQEVAFTNLTCFINLISFSVYLKKDIKNPFFKKLLTFFHRIFVFLNVTVTGIEACLFVYLWVNVPNGLLLYSIKEAEMTNEELIFSFIFIRVIPFLSSLFIYILSKEVVTATSFISSLVFFPLYFYQVKKCFEHYGLFPHPFLSALSGDDLKTLLIILTGITVIMLIPLDFIKKMQLKYSESNLNNTEYSKLESNSFLLYILDLINSSYNVISNFVVAVKISLPDFTLPNYQKIVDLVF